MFDPITLKLSVDPLILSALKEDVTSEDVTTNSVMREACMGQVDLICKEDGVICGLQVFTFSLSISSQINCLYSFSSFFLSSYGVKSTLSKLFVLVLSNSAVISFAALLAKTILSNNELLASLFLPWTPLQAVSPIA